jgi:DNA-binding transcriptional LysR family regulator
MLVAIADLGQLRKVAASLNVSPPAISKQVAEIEDALQQKILRREGSTLVFTAVGQLLTRHARDVLAKLENTRREVEELCTGVAGHIGLGAVPTVAPFLLPALLMHLKSRSPHTAVRLHENQFAQLAPMLEDGTIDIALARDIGQQLPAHFMSEDVLSDPLAVVCGSQHPLTAKRRLQWKDLDGVPWLLPFKGTPTRIDLDRLIAARGLTLPPGCVESISLSVNVSLLQNSPFVALMPLAYTQRYLDHDLVTVLPLSTGGIQSTIKVMWRRDNTNPVVALLLDGILQQTILL